MKKVGIVGYGSIGPVHAAALEKVQCAEFYAVCDVDDARIKACLEVYDVQAYSDFDTMLTDEKIDSIHICTPHYLHFDMIKKALAAGKYVVCEKPVTMKRKEFDELLTLDHADRVCVVLQNRFHNCVVKMREIVASKSLGEVMSARAVVAWNRPKEYYMQASWRGTRDMEGGGILINQSIHTLDFFNYIIGEIGDVKAHMMNFSLEDTIEVEDTVAAYLHLRDGQRGIFFATNAYGFVAAPEFEIYFEKGKVNYVDGKLFHKGQVIAENSNKYVGKSYWGDNHSRLLCNFYDKGEYFTPHDVKNTMYAMFAMYESAEENGKLIVL